MLCKFSLLVRIAIFWAHTYTTELEIDAMLVGLYCMINIIHTTPHYYLIPTLLATERYTSLFPVKTRNLLLMVTILFYFFESTAIKSLALWIYWYTYVVETDVSIAKVLLAFFVFLLNWTINLVNTSYLRFQWSPILVVITVHN
jgi:hypothetical protein